jgi:hypothetical protein
VSSNMSRGGHVTDAMSTRLNCELQVGVVIAWLFPAWHIVCIDLVRIRAIARSLHPMRELIMHAQHGVRSQIGWALRCMMHDA